jgi:thymidine kinase
MAKLYFFYSAMNAGKTSQLLQTNFNYEQRGMSTLLFAPAFDQREGLGIIKSRIGISASANIFFKETDLFQAINSHHNQSQVHAVFIDEAQFLTPAQVLQLTVVCDRLNIPVLTYGLRTDFRGEPFEGSKYLLAWSDTLTEIRTICKSGKKATMSARLDQDGNRIFEGEQIDIGYHYEPMARHMFQLDKASPIACKETPADRK